MKKMLTFILVGIFSFSGVVLFNNEVNAEELKSVSLWTACNNQWPGSKLNLFGSTVYDWKCTVYWSGLPENFDIDVSRQCRVQYGNRYMADYRDFNNPYSWYCKIRS